MIRLFPASTRSAISNPVIQMLPSASYLANAVSRSCSYAALEQAHVLWPTLAPLETTYPGFERWYWGKVVPGLEEGSRHIIRKGSPDQPSAVAIAKRDKDEAKICTLWVAENQRHQGFARLLLEEAIDWIGSKHPLFTVPGERYGEFQPLMKQFQFTETARIPSLYRLGVVEHIYNGQMLAPLNS
jgi:hypothetical protein